MSTSWEKPAGARPSPPHTRLPFLIGGLAIVAAVIALIVSGTAAGGRFFITVNEVVNDDAYAGQSVRVAGAVIGETIVYDAENLLIEFMIAHIPEQYDDLATALHDAVADPDATRMRVRVENAVKPELLRDEAQAILTGRIGADGVFLASELNLKCPTRFTEAGPMHEGVTPDADLPVDHPSNGSAEAIESAPVLPRLSESGA
ncbi:MAG: cytochrome c maturation protein CcmE [Chloroflexota bacterium]|nr:cytochrome c maturation protein CcmE [Chloroflexota bacterium]